MLPTRGRNGREAERANAVCNAKRLASMLEVGLCDATVLATFTATLRERPALLLERHAGNVGWTVFLLNRKDRPDEAREAGLAALRYFLDQDEDSDAVQTWVENVQALLKANGEDVTPEQAVSLARQTNRTVPGTSSPL